MTITMKVNSRDEWFSMMAELRNRGILERKDIFIPESFPIEIPVNLDKLLDLLENPLVKPFKKKIGANLQKNILQVKESVCV